MESMSGLIRKISIRGKLIFFMFVIIVITSLVNLYFYNKVYRYMDEYNRMLQGYSEINNMSIKLVQGLNNISGYINPDGDSAGDKSEINKYNVCMEETTVLVDNVFNSSGSLDTYLLSKAVKNSFETYREDINRLLYLSPEERYLQFLKEKDNSIYIEGYIKQLLDKKLAEGEWSHRQLTQRVNAIRTINSIVVLVLILLSFIYVVALSNSVTVPIKILTQFARNISKGDFPKREIVLNSSDDINILAQTLNKMSKSIQNIINIERKLHEEELERVKVSNELNEARFLALQSQINPHFLFNTLNAIARFAMFEGAKKTTELIESLSSIFRYNLKNTEEVLLEDELKIIHEYAHIQTARFGDRLKFEVVKRTDITNFKVPSFIIQPLVENAVIHGLESKESGGTVRIKIYKIKEGLKIKIIDNGIGISRDKLQHLFEGSCEDNTLTRAHTTGIGLKNVKERVNFYFRNRNCLSIKSKINFGSIITLNLWDDRKAIY